MALIRRAVRAVLLAAPATLLTHPLAVRAQSGVDADQVMAAFVFRFPQFVQWPDSAVAAADHVELCVGEAEPVAAPLRDIVEGQRLNGRPLAVRTVGRPDEVDGCHLLFLPEHEPARHALLAAAHQRPVLTVGSSERLLEEGGMIRLFILDRRIRFEIDADAARKAGLQVSAQLLALAVRVRGGRS